MFEIFLIAAAAAGYWFVLRPRMQQSPPQAGGQGTAPAQITAKVDDAALTARFEKHVAQFKADAEAMPKSGAETESSPDLLINKFKTAWAQRDVGELLESISMSLALQGMLAMLSTNDVAARVSNDLGAIVQDIRDKIDAISGKGKLVDQYVASFFKAPLVSTEDSPEAAALRELGAKIVVDVTDILSENTDNKLKTYVPNAGPGGETRIDYQVRFLKGSGSIGDPSETVVVGQAGKLGKVRVSDHAFVKTMTSPSGKANLFYGKVIEDGEVPSIAGKYIYLATPFSG